MDFFQCNLLNITPDFFTAFNEAISIVIYNLTIAGIMISQFPSVNISRMIK
jgi:hypothetical protein